MNEVGVIRVRGNCRRGELNLSDIKWAEITQRPDKCKIRSAGHGVRGE